MADALASGASEGNLVGVQVPPRPLGRGRATAAEIWARSVRTVQTGRAQMWNQTDRAQMRGRRPLPTPTLRLPVTAVEFSRRAPGRCLRCDESDRGRCVRCTVTVSACGATRFSSFAPLARG